MPERQHADDAERQREIVEHELRPRPCARPDAEDPVVAARQLDPLERGRPGDLREGERQHRQIDAREPHAEPAEEETRQTREQRRRHQSDRHRRGEPFDRERSAIGAEPEIGRMAEGMHAAGAHHQMQRRGEEREDREFRQEGDAVVADQRRPNNEPCQHRRAEELRRTVRGLEERLGHDLAACGMARRAAPSSP